MITDELMKKVRLLEIRTRRSVSEVFSGEYSSAFRGRGMEFSEVREYQPGDDVRAIDWNVTARMDAAYIKRYVEERELTVVLAVDLSASSRFGSVERAKNETAAELCGLLALAATRNKDKVGLLAFSDRVETHLPPKKGQKHVLRVIREVLGFTPRKGAGTDMAGALGELRRVLKRRAVIFVVSDFLLPGGDGVKEPMPPEVETALRLLARKHDVIAAVVNDPREESVPRVGLIELRDEETGRLVFLDTGSKRVRSRFAAASRKRLEGLERQLRRSGVDWVHVRTGEDYTHALVELFRRRERRR